jgi:alpha-tubulin suppressor-like RCC1 family protein
MRPDRGQQRSVGRAGSRLAALATISACCLAITATASAGYRSEGVVAWGGNAFGQVGNGTTTGPDLCLGGPCTAIPVSVSGLKRVRAVAAAADHGVALLRDGRVDAWGGNGTGQLGTGATANSAAPVPVCAAQQRLTEPTTECRGRLQGVIAISANTEDTEALLRGGSVLAWGANNFGQLGDATTAANSDIPVRVCAIGEAFPCRKPLTGVVAVSAGYGYDLALLQNGTVVAWGRNEFGTLGDGTTTSSNVPVPVSGLTAVKAIAAGGRFGMALLSDGMPMVWGWQYPLGHEPFAYEPLTPVPVEGLSDVKAIAAGSEHRLALLEDGTVEGWGMDPAGQVGYEGQVCVYSDICARTPALIPGLTGVSAIAAGGENSLALLNDGTVMAWGRPGDGQIGNDQFVWPWGYLSHYNDPTPTPVCQLDEVRGIASGGQLSLAYGKDGPGTPCKRVPAIARIAPERGPVGTAVKITGDNFTGATSVTFDKVAATFTVDSLTEITAIAPGPGLVQVTTPEGVNQNMFASAELELPFFSVE